MKRQSECCGKEKPNPKARQIIRFNATVAREEKIPSDAQGSYTGLSADGGAPVQDTDDL